jgi:hypothetical protein
MKDLNRPILIAMVIYLALLASQSYGQWVRVETVTTDGGKNVGSGVVVGDVGNVPIIVCAGHQFRGWDQKTLNVNGVAADVLYQRIDKGEDIAILSLSEAVKTIRPATIDEGVRDGEPIELWHDRQKLSGRWRSQQPMSDGTLVGGTLVGGMQHAYVPGVVSGWSGGPVYRADSTELLGIISTSDGKWVGWTPVSVVSQRLTETVPMMTDASAVTVYVATTANCAPCESFKRDLAAGSVARRGMRYCLLTAESPQMAEVTQKMHSQGYAVPQSHPWFWSPTCQCAPRIGYVSPLRLLEWLTPPILHPGRYQRSPYTQQVKDRAPDPEAQVAPQVPDKLEPVPDPRFEQLQRVTRDALARAAALEQRLIELEQAAASQPDEPAPAESGVPPPDAATADTGTTLKSGVKSVAGVAADAAASAVEGSPAVSGGVGDLLIGGATGGTGVAVLWGLRAASAFYRRRKERQVETADKPEHPPSPATGYPAQQVVPPQSIKWQNVQSDRYAKAHEEARRAIAKRYPGGQELLDAELSLVQQFMSGNHPKPHTEQERD